MGRVTMSAGSRGFVANRKALMLPSYAHGGQGWSHRLAWPRTEPSQGLNTGSNPVGTTTPHFVWAAASLSSCRHCWRRIRPSSVFSLMPNFVRAAGYSGAASLLSCPRIHATSSSAPHLLARTGASSSVASFHYCWRRVDLTSVFSFNMQVGSFQWFIKRSSSSELRDDSNSMPLSMTPLCLALD